MGYRLFFTPLPRSIKYHWPYHWGYFRVQFGCAANEKSLERKLGEAFKKQYVFTNKQKKTKEVHTHPTLLRRPSRAPTPLTPPTKQPSRTAPNCHRPRPASKIERRPPRHETTAGHRGRRTAPISPSKTGPRTAVLGRQNTPLQSPQGQKQAASKMDSEATTARHHGYAPREPAHPERLTPPSHRPANGHQPDEQNGDAGGPGAQR